MKRFKTIWQERYVADIAKGDRYYLRTKWDFYFWLLRKNLWSTFTNDLDKMETEEDLYYVALDYSIPVSMVKFFTPTAQLNNMRVSGSR